MTFSFLLWYLIFVFIYWHDKYKIQYKKNFTDCVSFLSLVILCFVPQLLLIVTQWTWVSNAVCTCVHKVLREKQNTRLCASLSSFCINHFFLGVLEALEGCPVFLFSFGFIGISSNFANYFSCRDRIKKIMKILTFTCYFHFLWFFLQR